MAHWLHEDNEQWLPYKLMDTSLLAGDAGVMTSVTRFGVNGGGISGDTGEMISNNGFISDTDIGNYLS